MHAHFLFILFDPVSDSNLKVTCQQHQQHGSSLWSWRFPVTTDSEGWLSVHGRLNKMDTYHVVWQKTQLQKHLLTSELSRLCILWPMQSLALKMHYGMKRHLSMLTTKPEVLVRCPVVLWPSGGTRAVQESSSWCMPAFGEWGDGMLRENTALEKLVVRFFYFLKSCLVINT